MIIGHSQLEKIPLSAERQAAMLQRQQQRPLWPPGRRFVEGAVGTVEMALERLNQSGVVELDEERKPPWSPTFWWCSAATTRPSPW